MLSVAIIVFRESLEVALVLGVIIAATRGLAGRNLWTAIGFAGGAAGAGIVALFTHALAHAAEGMGQELFNAIILFAAAALIGMTAVWMKSHARQSTQHIKEVGNSVKEGRLPLYSLSVVIMLAVWREGSEIVLFLYGMAISGQSATDLLAGSTIGFAGGITVGVLLYRGLLKMAARRMFHITGWLLILLSAGMASQGAKLLADAGVFTQLNTPVWSTAALLPEKSIFGQALHALLGYSAQPLGIQLVFYAATLAVLIAAMKYIERGTGPGAALKAAALAALFLLVRPEGAQALDGKVYSPQVNKGEAEIEYASTRTFDADKSKNDIQENQFSVGYGVTDFWAPEIYYATFQRGPGQPMDFTANEFENRFQFWPAGKYWLDAGLLASYHFAAKRNAADSVELKILLQKDFGHFTTLVNAGGEREVGSHSTAGNGLTSAVNTRYRWLPQFEPGIELQSGYGMWGDHLSFNQQEHYLGPIAYGKVLPQTLPGLKYEAGYFVGISSAAASNAMRLKLEYEMYF